MDEKQQKKTKKLHPLQIRKLWTSLHAHCFFENSSLKSAA